MDTKALQLISKFSFAPNQRGFCGLTTANPIFTACLESGNCEPVPEAIIHFKGLMPYLNTIAAVTNLDPFSFDVASAYWLGNHLLGSFKPSHYDLLIKELAKQQLPDLFISKLKKNRPKVFIPLHLFNVLHVGVGQITGSVEFNLENINQCMIRWGRVDTINTLAQTAAVYIVRLQPGNARRYVLKDANEIISINPTLTPNLKPNDMVAVHWNLATHILTQAEQSNLSSWTNDLLTSFD